MFSWLTPYRTPLIVAHRGSSAIAPENTLAAFRRAIEDGADAVELDVQLTSDAEVVVFHDRRLERTTNGRGKVSEKTLSELRTLDAGSWFNSRFSSEHIPTLGEVFEALSGTVGINIEIKVDGQSSDRQFELIERCCDLIEQHKRETTVLVSSFSSRAVKQVKLNYPRLATGLLYHPVHHFGKSPIALARSISAEYVIVNGTTMRKHLVHQAHDRGFHVGEYTIDTGRRMSRALRYHLDVVITNDPAAIRKLMTFS